MVLDNGRIMAKFDDRGLVSIGLPKTAGRFRSPPIPPR